MRLGAIQAGGRSLRFGAPKALATVGGVRILDRVRTSLEVATEQILLVANEPETFADAALPIRGDALPGSGALGGIHTALLWARERGADGVLSIACDMPFVPAALLNELRTIADSRDWDVVAPESGGRRGVEPLCAWYGIACIAAIEAAVAREDRRVIAFFEDVRVAALPLEAVRVFGDPGTLFMNVNTQEDLDRAEAIAAELGHG